MSLLDRLITLSLLDLNIALAKVENPEQVRDAVLNELGGVLESAGAELRQLQRNRDGLLQNRRVAEKELDEKRSALEATPEAEKDHAKKQIAAFDDALVRMDEQIAEQNREEASLHKYVSRLQELRREAAEWSPRRRSETKTETKTGSIGTSSTREKTETSNGRPASESKATADKKVENAPAQESSPQEDPTDPFVKMKRLKERMEAFQARAAIDEEELQAFLTEKAIAEEETRRIIEEHLSELKKKMNQ
jgi:hypothetical protein